MKIRKEKFILNLWLFGLLLVSCKSSYLNSSETFECNLYPKEARDFKVDDFGHLYIIEKTNNLSLLDDQMEILFTYFNNGLGDISYIDITNPRKILVFFKDFQKVIFLDNTLSEIERLEWNVDEAYDIRAIGTARDNNIWIYDALDYKLKKINAQGGVMLESLPLQTYLEINIIPDYIIEMDNEVHLVEEGRGITTFDNFGNYLRHTPIQAKSVWLRGATLRYLKDQALFERDLQNPVKEDEMLAHFPEPAQKAFRYRDSFFYLSNGCLKKI